MPKKRSDQLKEETARIHKNTIDFQKKKKEKREDNK